MSPNPVVAGPEKRVLEARALMADLGFGVLPVVDGRGRLEGLVARSDLLTEAECPTLGGIMTRNVLTVFPGDLLADAARLLTSEVLHHLVVIAEDRRPVGVVSVRDVARGVGELALDTPVIAVMSPHLLSVPRGTRIDDVRGYLGPHGITSVVVTDPQAGVVGVVSRAVAAAADPGLSLVESIMAAAPERVPPRSALSGIAQRLGRPGSGPILVAGATGDVVGVVTASDVTRWLAGHEAPTVGWSSDAGPGAQA